ncbi:hypothetical protein SAMN00790413_06086 [Deinococcus hopiensis KR-140]|uniref:Uncharacterized protein n=1 Tax=Deinococcus hopiensis KR-140 TaxID=695939 RepID=A0A1W1VW72_9DEIO|nr:hypothetical protein SAMN00790413_06086 [Deinococcus hopiensis KR-140]
MAACFKEGWRRIPSTSGPPFALQSGKGSDPPFPCPSKAPVNLTPLLSKSAFVLLSTSLSARLAITGYTLQNPRVRSPWVLILLALLSAAGFIALNPGVSLPPFTLSLAPLLHTVSLLAVSVLASLVCLILAAVRAQHSRRHTTSPLCDNLPAPPFGGCLSWVSRVRSFHPTTRADRVKSAGSPLRGLLCWRGRSPLDASAHLHPHRSPCQKTVRPALVHLGCGFRERCSQVPRRAARTPPNLPLEPCFNASPLRQPPCITLSPCSKTIWPFTLVSPKKPSRRPSRNSKTTRPTKASPGISAKPGWAAPSRSTSKRKPCRRSTRPRNASSSSWTKRDLTSTPEASQDRLPAPSKGALSSPGLTPPASHRGAGGAPFPHLHTSRTITSSVFQQPCAASATPTPALRALPQAILHAAERGDRIERPSRRASVLNPQANPSGATGKNGDPEEMERLIHKPHHSGQGFGRLHVQPVLNVRAHRVLRLIGEQFLPDLPGRCTDVLTGPQIAVLRENSAG